MARTCAGSGLWLLLLRDLRTHVIHVERLHLRQQVVERRARQRAWLAVDQDLIAEDHERGDRTDLELARETLFFFGVDLSEHHVGVLLGCLLEDRREAPARPAPAGPEVEDDDR